MDAQIRYANVEFKKRGNTFRGSVPIGDLALLPNDPADTMNKATLIYQNAVMEINGWHQDADALRKARTPMPVRKVWELGDILHRLTAGLAQQGCRVENLYDHLERHAGIPSKRASSFVTLRRYVDDVEMIPHELQWNRILKTVKSTSQAIADGSLLDSQV